MPSSRSGVRATKRSSGPTRRGKDRDARSARRRRTPAASLNVLHSRRRASSRSRSSHRASSSSRSTSSRSGQEPAGLQLDQRGGDEQELRGHVQVHGLQPLDLGQVGVHDAGQRDLVEVDLLPQDQVQQQVEGPVEDLGRHLVRHTSRVPGPTPATAASPAPGGAGTRVRGRESDPVHSGAAGSLAGRDPCPVLHPAHRRGPPRQLPGRAAELGRSGSTRCDAFHGIVDLHALTVPQDPGVVGRQTLELAATLFAVGPGPRRRHGLRPEPRPRALPAVLDHGVHGLRRRAAAHGPVQGQVGQAGRGFISAGLLTYPALQAADILLYDADEVPVGEDQRQHVEITRDIAIRFNHRFGDTFVVPKAVLPKRRRPGHGPAGARRRRCRSRPTSDAGLINLLRRPRDHPQEVQAGRDGLRGPRSASTGTAKPGVSNLLEIQAAATGRSPEEIAAGYTQYGPLKADTGEAVVELLRPIQAALPGAPGRPGPSWPRSWPRGRTRPAPWPRRRSLAPTTPSACCPQAEPFQGPTLPACLIRSCPQRARVVVVGGGVIGCSVAYHLAHMGWTDVVLLERDRLTSGTTWHAAGLMVTFGSTSETSTEMRKYTRDLYARLEAETGQSTGFKPVGFIEVATDADRLEEYRRVSAFNRYCGVDVHEISPREVQELFPLARTDDILAGFYVAEDGRANPVDVTMSLAKGARQRGRHDRRGRARHRLHCSERGAVTGVRTRVRRHRGRVRRELRRHVGAPARREGRRHHPAAGGRALLPHHRADRGPLGRVAGARGPGAPTATSARRSAA